MGERVSVEKNLLPPSQLTSDLFNQLRNCLLCAIMLRLFYGTNPSRALRLASLFYCSWTNFYWILSVNIWLSFFNHCKLMSPRDNKNSNLSSLIVTLNIGWKLIEGSAHIKHWNYMQFSQWEIFTSISISSLGKSLEKSAWKIAI